MSRASRFKDELRNWAWNLYFVRYGRLATYLRAARRTPGWTTSRELIALGRAAASLPDDAVIVEIGSFLGRSSIVMAGARKLKGSGEVHCVDPFDGSGDEFSVPVYRGIISGLPGTLRERFHANALAAGVDSWLQVHQATAENASLVWSTPIDMLFLDGDQSPSGVYSAYSSWKSFIKIGGIVAVHNSAPRKYEPSHEGHRLLVLNTIKPPQYDRVALIDSTTFARLVAATALIDNARLDSST